MIEIHLTVIDTEAPQPPAPKVAIESEMDVYRLMAAEARPVLMRLDAQAPDLEAAHTLISNSAMALAQYGRRMDEQRAKDGF